MSLSLFLWQQGVRGVVIYGPSLSGRSTLASKLTELLKSSAGERKAQGELVGSAYLLDDKPEESVNEALEQIAAPNRFVLVLNSSKLSKRTLEKLADCVVIHCEAPGKNRLIFDYATDRGLYVEC